MKKIIIAIMLCTVALTSCTFKKNSIKLIAVEMNDQWGYVNLKGSFVINPQFDKAYPFFDGLARVVSDGKVGYISTKGEYIVQPQYLDGTDFSEGYAFVVTENSYPICINKKGKEVFCLINTVAVGSFKDGLAPYKSKFEKWGYIDKKGNTVIPASFSDANYFHEGLASVNNNGKYGFIGKDGNNVIPYQFEEASDFHEGLAVVNNGKMSGFIDKKGKYVINPQFDYVEDFHEGLAAFRKGGKTGYIDKNGKYIINPQFEEGDDFSKGLASVQFGDMYGYIDTEGKIIINPQFDYAWPFFGNLAKVKSNDVYGFIDKKGKYVINPQFDNCIIYDNNLSHVNSTYFDATSFTNNFLGTFKLGTVIMSTFKHGSTLRTIEQSSYFGSSDVKNNYTLEYSEDNWGFTGDIQLSSIEFGFSEQMCETYYDYYYDSHRSYNYEAKIFDVACHFYLTGNAYGKGMALATSLAEIAKKRGYISSIQSDGNMLYGYCEKNKQGILIIYTDSELYFVQFPVSKVVFDDKIESIVNG